LSGCLSGGCQGAVRGCKRVVRGLSRDCDTYSNLPQLEYLSNAHQDGKQPTRVVRGLSGGCQGAVRGLSGDCQGVGKVGYCISRWNTTKWVVRGL